MTRMWMVSPEYMCRNHLLGEHLELHVIVDNLRKKYSITGWINSNCIEVNSILDRHTKIVEEMKRRGYNHNSPLLNFDPSYLPYNEHYYIIDRTQSYNLLKIRCKKCKLP